jgi:hypothetical protein
MHQVGFKFNFNLYYKCFFLNLKRAKSYEILAMSTDLLRRVMLNA